MVVAVLLCTQTQGEIIITIFIYMYPTHRRLIQLFKVQISASVATGIERKHTDMY
jgi:hypothetical protein